MPQIRHVHFSPRTLYYHHLPKLVQGNLQTLSWLSLPQRLQTEPDFKAIPNVKELGIHLMGFTWDLQPHISMEGLLNLHQLENLKFERDGGCLKCDSKVLKAFPSNLKKLTLIRTNFSWEDMAIISTLPNLEVLKLREDAFCGPEWKATGNGFCKLKYLEVNRLLSLKHWSVDADHFPILECIFLYLCPDLVEFPTGFGEINTLRLIDLKRCHLSLVTSAKKFQEERRDLGDDRLVLREFYTYRLIGLKEYLALGSSALFWKVDELTEEVVDMSWKESENYIDCGLFVMRHMETYKGTLKKWNPGFKKKAKLNTFIVETIGPNAPREVWKSPIHMLDDMLQLRHVMFSKSSLYLPCGVRTKLEAISCLYHRPELWPSSQNIRNIPNVKKLGIYIDITPVSDPKLLPKDASQQHSSLNDLVDLQWLENLKINVPQIIHFQDAFRLPALFPPNFKKLTLQ
nr:putative late blight resistance protein homolog R1B-14 isoform X1 [Ipomoea batatas]